MTDFLEKNGAVFQDLKEKLSTYFEHLDIVKIRLKQICAQARFR